MMTMILGNKNDCAPPAPPVFTALSYPRDPLASCLYRKGFESAFLEIDSAIQRHTTSLSSGSCAADSIGGAGATGDAALAAAAGPQHGNALPLGDRNRNKMTTAIGGRASGRVVKPGVDFGGDSGGEQGVGGWHPMPGQSAGNKRSRT